MSSTQLKKIAVIGSNSFSGSDFVDYLLSQDRFDVLGVSRSPEKAPLFLPYLKRNDAAFEFFQADLNHDIEKLLAKLDEFQPDAIINFAAQSEVGPSWDHPDHWFQTNAVALTKFINGLKDKAYLKRYLHVSSPEVYGTCSGNVTEDHPLNPSTPYAASKAAGDLSLFTYQKNFDFPLLMVRATNVYGAHQQLFKIIPRSFIYIKTNQKIELHGGGVAQKSYIHIRDVSRGELAILEKGTVGEIYHLSPSQAIAVKDVVQNICDVMGEDFSERTIVGPERLGQDAIYQIDSSKARKELGWTDEIQFADGIKQVKAWVDEYWDEIRDQPLKYEHKE